VSVPLAGRYRAVRPAAIVNGTCAITQEFPATRRNDKQDWQATVHGNVYPAEKILELSRI